MSDEDLASAGTLPLEDSTDMASFASGPPVSQWDRYEVLERLGTGGMGTVYRARDPRLDRTIAIKFIHGADPNLAVRLKHEARALARIDHPNICHVYEVGDVAGHPYIALQLIDGQPLAGAAAAMTLDEKIAVMRDVALAIQEAHRLGVVHRDLKPANILVERTEDGRWFPVVMDFGLAREVTVEIGMTQSGMPLGTPAYMSPEQARGDLRAIDRRSDVYGLGATLFELLTGGPPFTATSLPQLLAQVLHDDAPAPRSFAPSLPIDLETIALKCLAKDPVQRYPSARALADDLGRYLDGEPILGRRVPLWQRVRLRVRRHRTLVLLGASSLLIVAAVASLGLRAWISARAERALTAGRTRLAEQLGRETKELELALEVDYLRPLHDTGSDRARVRDRMRAITATRHDLGRLGDAVIHHALGRGHLALHQWREAADELARAAAAGLDLPELHAARGRALGEIYRSEAENARITGSKPWFARRRVELEQQYLIAARAELARSAGSGEDAALVEARIALYRGDYASAERRAREVADHTQLVEARRLAADAAYSAAIETFDRGEHDAAGTGLEAAAALYAEASEIARSDALLYKAEAQAWLQRAEVDFRQGGTPRESLERAIAAIERALRAAPDDARGNTLHAYILLRWYQTPALRAAVDTNELLDRIEAAAARGVELAPHDAAAWDGLASAHIHRGFAAREHGGDEVPWMKRARDDLQKALDVDPDHHWSNNDLGVTLRRLGESADQTGGDPMPYYRAALGSFEHAFELDPDYLYACTNQADLHGLIAEHDRTNGIDPAPAVERALRIGQRCLEINPNYYAMLGTQAQSELVLARHRVDTGGDPTAPLAAAQRYLDRALTIQDNNMVTWSYRLITAITEARFQLRERRDPNSSLRTAREALRRALDLAPGSAYCYRAAARLGLLEAEWAARTGASRATLLARALADAEQAVKLDGRSAEGLLIAAEVTLELAGAQRSPPLVERGIAHVDQALQRNPRLPGAHTVRAALLQLRNP